ncbi:MAG TPA: DUF4193 family protein [Dermatophilaceae bacterium]
MATDYDKPRTSDTDEPAEHSVVALNAARVMSGASLGDDADPLDSQLNPPDADLSGEEWTVPVIPRQADEFTCASCYLVHHRSQLADERHLTCNDCTA